MRGRNDGAAIAKHARVNELPVLQSKWSLAPALVAISEYLMANAPGRWNGLGGGGFGK